VVCIYAHVCIHGHIMQSFYKDNSDDEVCMCVCMCVYVCMSMCGMYIRTCMYICTHNAVVL
jgi:hypothetical protein